MNIFLTSLDFLFLVIFHLFRDFHTFMAKSVSTTQHENGQWLLRTSKTRGMKIRIDNEISLLHRCHSILYRGPFPPTGVALSINSPFFRYLKNNSQVLITRSPNFERSQDT